MQERMGWFKKLLNPSRASEAPNWRTMPISLTNEALNFLTTTLKDQDYPAGVEGAFATMRIVQRAVRISFGQDLIDKKINPLSPADLQFLMENGTLDLSTKNILKEVRAWEEDDQ